MLWGDRFLICSIGMGPRDAEYDAQMSMIVSVTTGYIDTGDTR